MRPHAADETRLPNSKSGRQNLAALGTTAGQNLAAVGSSHSLTETVDLGTMTAAGLVGTLHYGYTSYDEILCSIPEPYRHSNPCLGTNTVVPMYYNRKGPFGQPLFSRFSGELRGCVPGAIVDRVNQKDWGQTTTVIARPQAVAIRSPSGPRWGPGNASHCLGCGLPRRALPSSQ